jgi:hypothetical protein
LKKKGISKFELTSILSKLYQSEFTSLGGEITSTPAVAKNADCRLEVFVRGTDGKLYHKWQLSPGSHSWSDWGSLEGEITSTQAVIRMPTVGLRSLYMVLMGLCGTDIKPFLAVGLSGSL